jgi:hypothetical protein
MLKLLEFRALSSAEKAAYVLGHGQYIHFRIKGWCKIDLYLVKNGPGPADSFYAELWYYYDLKSVGLVRVFEAAPPLEPYTENIHFRFSGK